MNKKALIAALVLGSSSVAMAAPVVVNAKANVAIEFSPAPVTIRDHREPAKQPPAPVVIRDHRTDWRRPVYPQPVYSPPIYQPVVYQPPVRRWETIAAGINLGTDGRTFINMYGKGAFGALRIDAAAGGTVIREVAIEFTDKSTQVLRGLNRVVDQYHPLTIDLDGSRRTINRVIVYGPKGQNPGFYGRNVVTLSAI